MWRLWTRGWGVRDWWFWVKDGAFARLVVWNMPRSLAYWAYLRVYVASNDGMTEEAHRTMKAWEAGAGK